MSTALLITIVLGLGSVLQATLNRELSLGWGLAPAGLLNMFVAFVVGLGFLALCVQRGATDGLFRVNFDLSLWRWWWVLPGLFGAGIVFGLPWALQKLGALSMFVALVATQVCASAAWDHFVVGTALSTSRLIGAVLAVLGVVLASGK